MRSFRAQRVIRLFVQPDIRKPKNTDGLRPAEHLHLSSEIPLRWSCRGAGAPFRMTELQGG